MSSLNFDDIANNYHLIVLVITYLVVIETFCHHNVYYYFLYSKKFLKYFVYCFKLFIFIGSTIYNVLLYVISTYELNINNICAVKIKNKNNSTSYRITNGNKNKL